MRAEPNRVSDPRFRTRTKGATGTFLGFEKVEASHDDLVPYKNRLPRELRESLLTEAQWRDRGREVLDEAQAYAQHPCMDAHRTCDYYLERDTRRTGEEGA